MSTTSTSDLTDKSDMLSSKSLEDEAVARMAFCEDSGGQREKKRACVRISSYIRFESLPLSRRAPRRRLPMVAVQVADPAKSIRRIFKYKG
jgi:hypothetical protein